MYVAAYVISDDNCYRLGGYLTHSGVKRHARRTVVASDATERVKDAAEAIWMQLPEIIIILSNNQFDNQSKLNKGGIGLIGQIFLDKREDVARQKQHKA